MFAAFLPGTVTANHLAGARWNRRRMVLVAVCSGLVAGTTGCGSAGYDSSLSAAQIRFVHVSPGSPEMDFFVNGTGAAYGVGFTNYTSYLPVLPGPGTVGVRRQGTEFMLSATEATLAGGHQYTAVVSRGLGNLREQILADQETPAAAGTVAIRVLNEVEGETPLKLYVSPNNSGPTPPPAVVRSLATGSSTGYMTLPVGSYTLTLSVVEGALSMPLGSTVVRAGSGAVRTVVFAGTAQAGGRRVAGFVLDDADAP